MFSCPTECHCCIIHVSVFSVVMCIFSKYIFDIYQILRPLHTHGRTDSIRPPLLPLEHCLEHALLFVLGFD